MTSGQSMCQGRSRQEERERQTDRRCGALPKLRSNAHCPPPPCHTHAFSMSCSSSCTLRLSSSAGGKPLPTFMKSAAILLLRRKPAALRRSPCSTQASTAAVGTQSSVVRSTLFSAKSNLTPQENAAMPTRQAHQRNQERLGSRLATAAHIRQPAACCGTNGFPPFCLCPPLKRGYRVSSDLSGCC